MQMNQSQSCCNRFVSCLYTLNVSDCVEDMGLFVL
jgi:hypothetical protein